MTDAYIYDAVRTPRGKGRKDGSLHSLHCVGIHGLAHRCQGCCVIGAVVWGHISRCEHKDHRC